MRFKSGKRERRLKKLAKKNIAILVIALKNLADTVGRVVRAITMSYYAAKELIKAAQTMRAAVDELPKENAEHCIVCGDIIPEGRQVCPKCEKGYDGVIIGVDIASTSDATGGGAL